MYTQESTTPKVTECLYHPPKVPPFQLWQNGHHRKLMVLTDFKCPGELHKEHSHCRSPYYYQAIQLLLSSWSETLYAPNKNLSFSHSPILASTVPHCLFVFWLYEVPQTVAPSDICYFMPALFNLAQCLQGPTLLSRVISPSTLRLDHGLCHALMGCFALLWITLLWIWMYWLFYIFKVKNKTKLKTRY